MRIKRIIISILLLLVTISCGNKKAISKPDLDNPEGIIKQLEVLLDESNPNEEEIVSLMVDLMSQPDPAKKHLAMNYLHKIYRFDIMNGNKYWINRALEDPNACSKLINEITENWAIWESRGEIDELYFASRTLTTQSCLDISDWLWERIADPTDEHIGFYIDQTWLCNRLSPEKVDLLVTAIADKNHKKFSRRRLFNFITYFAIDKLENDHWIKLLSVLEDNILPEKEALLFIEKRLDHASPIPGQRIGELVVNKNIPNNVRYALIQRYGEKIPEEAFLLIVDNKHDNDEMRLHALRLLPTNSSQKLFLEILMNDSESEALRLYALDNLDASWNQNLEKKCESFCQADIGSKLCAHALFLANRKNSVKFNAITAEAVERVVRTANEPAFLLDFYSGVVNPRVFRLLSHDTQLYLNAVDQLYICDGVLWLTFNKKILRQIELTAIKSIMDGGTLIVRGYTKENVKKEMSNLEQEFNSVKNLYAHHVELAVVFQHEIKDESLKKQMEKILTISNDHSKYFKSTVIIRPLFLQYQNEIDSLVRKHAKQLVKMPYQGRVWKN